MSLDVLFLNRIFQLYILRLFLSSMILIVFNIRLVFGIDGATGGENQWLKDRLLITRGESSSFSKEVNSMPNSGVMLGE